MFLILALILATTASVSAYVYEMNRNNRSMVVHRLYVKPTYIAKNPLTPTRNAHANHTRLPDGYRLPGKKQYNTTQQPLNKTNSSTAKPVPAPAPVPVAKSLRH